MNLNESDGKNKANKARKGRPNTSFDDDVADRTTLPLDMRAMRAFIAWEPARLSLLMRLVYIVWIKQEPLPADLLLMPSSLIRRITGVDARSIRTHYDQEMKDAISILVRRRAPLYDGSRDQIFNDCDGICFHCGCDLDIKNFHVDHLIPISGGGLTHRENLVASCAPCNLTKGARQ